MTEKATNVKISLRIHETDVWRVVDEFQGAPATVTVDTECEEPLHRDVHVSCDWTRLARTVERLRFALGDRVPGYRQSLHAAPGSRVSGVSQNINIS